MWLITKINPGTITVSNAQSVPVVWPTSALFAIMEKFTVLIVPNDCKKQTATAVKMDFRALLSKTVLVKEQVFAC